MTVFLVIYILLSAMFPFAVSMIPKTALWITRKPLSQPAATTSHSFRLFATKSNDQPPPPPSPRGFKPPVPLRSQNLLIVGLGNPGPDYDGTRHNIGFAALDAFAAMHPGGALKATSKFGADYGAIRVGTKNVGLLKPTTYINNSGKPLLAIMKHFKLSAADILVLADDVALDCGDVKLKERGSHGGHNGFRDIETVLGSRDWARVRIGVGKPPDRAGLVDHVLGRFTGGEQASMGLAVAQCCDVVRDWIVMDDKQAVMNKYNNSNNSSNNNKPPSAPPSAPSPAD